MTDALTLVLIPYARFLEGRERRFSIAAELTPQDGPCPVEAEVLPAAIAHDERIRDAARFLETDLAAGVEQS